MSKGDARYVRRDAKTGSFVVDKRYVKTQAKEAVSLFLAPVSGVYKSAVAAAPDYLSGALQRAGLINR